MMFKPNCVIDMLDRLYREGGYCVARSSEHSKWGMHALHVSSKGSVNNYVPLQKLRHPLLALLGFDGRVRGVDPVKLARPMSAWGILVSGWMLAGGVTLWWLMFWRRK